MTWHICFGFIGIQELKKKKKNLPATFFALLSNHYGFTNYFEILNVCFSNIGKGYY